MKNSYSCWYWRVHYSHIVFKLPNYEGCKPAPLYLIDDSFSVRAV